MTGRAATSLLADQPFPSADVLDAAGLPARRCRRASGRARSWASSARTPRAQLGLDPGVPVVAGIVDAFASFHGAGMTAKGDAIDVGGAAGGFGVYWDRPAPACRASFATTAPLPGLYCVGGAMAATGRAIDWFRTEVLAGSTSTEDLLEEAAAIAAGRRGPASSCRTSPASARRSGIRRRAARSSG